MKLIIDIPEMAYDVYKEWHKNKVATVEQSLIANGKPYEERPQVIVFCENADEKTIADLKNELTQDLINKITVNAGLAQPIKDTRLQGEWQYNQYDGNPRIGNWHCSECKHIIFGYGLRKPNYNFCPYCGIKMQNNER